MTRWMAFAAFCLLQTASAQSSGKLLDFNQHAWLSYSGDHPVSGRWGVHFDAQWRRSDLGTEWQQYQLRPGVNYSPSRSVMLTLGYVYTRGYPYGDFPPVRAAFPEHRIYQQGLFRQRAGGVRVQHRLRLEQRFIAYPNQQPREWTYQNRFRYLLKAEFPIGGDGSRWYVPVFNEIFIGFAPNYGARPFDHNRLFAGIGRVLPKAKIEVGYMNQFLSQRNGRIFEFNNTLFATITSDVPLSKLWKR